MRVSLLDSWSPSRKIGSKHAGLTGGSHDSYVKHMVVACRTSGLRSIVFNSRGTSDGPVTSPPVLLCFIHRRHAVGVP